MSRDLDESLSGMAAKALQRILVQEALKENVTQPITIYGYNILLDTSVLINTGFELIWTMLYHRIGHLKLNKRLFWPTCLTFRILAALTLSDLGILMTFSRMTWNR